MKCDLFELEPFSYFTLNKKGYFMIELKKEYRPTLGKVFVAVCKDENKKICKFLKNWRVEVEEEKRYII